MYGACIHAISGTTRLTHWGRVTHICVSRLSITGSDNGLSPGRRQAIIWTNPGILLIGPLGTNFSEILIEIKTFSFTKIHFKMSSAKRRPFCLGLNVLKRSKHDDATVWKVFHITVGLWWDPPFVGAINSQSASNEELWHLFWLIV